VLAAHRPELHGARGRAFEAEEPRAGFGAAVSATHKKAHNFIGIFPLVESWLRGASAPLNRRIRLPLQYLTDAERMALSIPGIIGKRLTCLPAQV
jgi:hypothetical protein